MFTIALKRVEEGSLLLDLLGHRRHYPRGTGPLRMNTGLAGALTVDFLASRMARSKRFAWFWRLVSMRCGRPSLSSCSAWWTEEVSMNATGWGPQLGSSTWWPLSMAYPSCVMVLWWRWFVLQSFILPRTQNNYVGKTRGNALPCAFSKVKETKTENEGRNIRLPSCYHYR